VKRKRQWPAKPAPPAAENLPSGIAASIGRMIARHSYLDWILANVLYALLSISIKQGRVAVRIPPPRLYITTVADLLAFQRLHLGFNLGALERKLLAADQARNTLGHSVFAKDERSGKLHVYLVSGTWDVAHALEAGRRGLMSEKIEVTRGFLAAKRGAIEDAIKAARQLAEQVDAGLQALNQIRRTRRALDRRSPARSRMKEQGRRRKEDG
jgi:hypothetical protein